MSPDEVIPSGDPEMTPFILLMVFGFLVGVGGHIYKSNTMIATGIALVFLAVIVLPLIFLGGGA